MDGFWYGIIWTILYSLAIIVTKKWFRYICINFKTFGKTAFVFVWFLLMIGTVVFGLIPILKLPYVHSALFNPATLFPANTSQLKILAFWLWFWMILIATVYVIMSFLLVTSINSMHMLVNKEGEGGWSDTKKEFFKGIQERRNHLSSLIKRVNAISHQISAKNTQMQKQLSRLSKQRNLDNKSSPEDQTESHTSFDNDFNGFVNTIIEQLGCKIVYDDSENSIINIDTNLVSKLKKITFVTATPVLHSLQSDKPIYNRDAPEPWQSLFCEPLLQILDQANMLENFTWVYLSPESLKNRLGFVKLNPLCSTTRYSEGLKSFLFSIRQRLTRPERVHIVYPLFQEVAYLPLVMAIIERVDGSGHVSVGLERVIDDTKIGAAVDVENNLVRSCEFAQSFPSIHSSNHMMVAFFKGFTHDLIHRDKRYAEAIQDFLRFGKDTGTKMIFQAKFDGSRHDADDHRGEVTHVLFT